MAHVRTAQDKWSWELFIATDTAIRPAWTELVAAPWKANEVPVEQRGHVLEVGVDGWQLSTQKGMTT